MKAARATSIIVWLVLSAAAVGAAALSASVAEAPAGQGHLLWLAGLVTGAIGLAVLPFGLAIDRALARLGKQVERLAEAEQLDPGAISHSHLLSPVTRAFTGAVDRLRTRETVLRAQLRDLEIRHRVSESDRRQVEAVLNSLRDAVIVTDPFLEIVMVNEAAARTLGFRLDEALHRPLSDVLQDHVLGQLIADAREVGNAFERRHVEHRMTTGGNNSVFDVTLACVENHKGEVGSVLAVLHDMTREREVSEMKSDFVSKASHELRTPLSSIRAYVEMLVDGEAQDEQSRAEFYRIIQSETDRLGRLIDNMLNISRIEAGIIQVDRENVDMVDTITRAVNSLEPQGREKHITLSKRLSDVGLTVEGDADMLYQVVINLISNAVKYTPEGGRVTVTADTDNLTRSVVVTVSDTGLGIPPDALPRLFDKFFRVENYKRVAKGTGLGLSLCRHIVETVHGGQIGVESQLGMGSKFWFSVPMRYAGRNAA